MKSVVYANIVVEMVFQKQPYLMS